MRNSLLFILIASLWGIMMIFVGCDDTKEFEDMNLEDDDLPPEI